MDIVTTEQPIPAGCSASIVFWDMDTPALPLPALHSTDCVPFLCSRAPQQAIDSYSFHPTGFLTKPVSVSSLWDAMGRCARLWFSSLLRLEVLSERAKIDVTDWSSGFPAVFHPTSAQLRSQPGPCTGGQRLFSSGESLLSALRGPLPIHLLFLDIYKPGLSGVETARRIRASGSEVSTRRRLDDLESAIDSGNFLRCHQSFLVNLNHAEGVQGCDFLMSDQALIPISSANSARIRAQFID